MSTITLDSIHLIVVFVRVAAARSFTLAASQLNLSRSATSKALTRLEEKLGVRLVLRSTRSLRLTDEGELLLESCKNILAEIENAEARLSRNMSQPAGRIRLHSTIGFGRLVVVPLLSEFARQWPAVHIDVELSERSVNLLQESVDLTIRFGELPDSGLVARHLGHMQFATIASPDYLARHGTPAHPQELDEHACLGYFLPLHSRYRDWEYSGGMTRKTPSAHLNFNNAQALVEAAIDGHGIAHVPRMLAYEALQAKQVRQILAACETSGWPVSLVYSERRYQSQRIRSVVDWLVDRISSDMRWQSPAGARPSRRARPPARKGKSA